jgi:hypothetical protein
MNKFINFIFLVLLNIIPVEGSEFRREDGDKMFKVHLYNEVPGLDAYKPKYVLECKDKNHRWDLIRDCEVTVTLTRKDTMNSLSKTVPIVRYDEAMTIVIPLDNPEAIARIFLSVHGKGCVSLREKEDWESLGLGVAVADSAISGQGWVSDNNLYGYFKNNEHSYSVFFGNKFMTS